MSSDLRVALRIQANAGASRREIQALERDLRQAGKEGAGALAGEAGKSGRALTRTAQSGAASYRIIRQAMREAAGQGAGVFRQGVVLTQGELKQLGQLGRQAARETRQELIKTDREGMQQLARSTDRAESNLRRLAQSGGRHLRTLKTLASAMRGEFDRLKHFGGSTMGQLAGLGVGFGVASSAVDSAQLDRRLIRAQQGAGMSHAERDEWRGELYRLSRQYGVERDQVQGGFETLLASGLNYQQSKAGSEAIAQASSVTGADSGILAKALVAGANAFDIDLAKPGAAVDLLQKMTVAGRLGNAELENLASIFPKIGGDAKRAGMDMAQALAFVETLSLVELDPERLGTLAQSTLRMFTNGAYRKEITRTTGVEFFQDGAARDPQEVFNDLKRKYDTLGTDQERARFMSVVFGKTDLDTQKGANIMLSADYLDKFAAGTQTTRQGDAIYKQDLGDNLSSATAVGARMKATLGEAIDRMAQPLNKSFADFGSYLLDDLNLSGEQLLAGGVAAGVGGYYAGRGAKAGAGALLNKFLGGPETLKNIAVGKVLEEATGVQSVFVTNWPATLGGQSVDIDLGRDRGRPKSTGSRMPDPADAARTATLLAVPAAMTQLGGSSAQGDEERLAMLPRNKLLNDGEKAYQDAFYRHRIALAGQVPEGMAYGEQQRWLTENARRLAQQETGLAHNGKPVADVRAWADNVMSRALQSIPQARPAIDLSPQEYGGSASYAPKLEWTRRLAGKLDEGEPGDRAQVSASGMAEQRLAELLDKPLVIEVRADSNLISAEVERRAGLHVRRG